jgi:surface protein
MPARYDDYNISIRNAYIAPKTHNTMLYPLLVNEDDPITGTLYYRMYTGKHLSWSFAYTKQVGSQLHIYQPYDELLNSYKYKYNAFYQTDYEFDNPYEVAKYTSNASGVLPNFNAEFAYTYDEIDNGDGTYTTKIYTDSLDNLPTLINFIGRPIISVDKLNTSQARNLQSLFQSCAKLERVDTRYWDTSKVTTMKQAFYYNQSLTSLDLSNLDTSNVRDMAGMFNGCSGLTSLDVSGFDTGEVINMVDMFKGCGGLTSLDLSGFDVSNVLI